MVFTYTKEQSLSYGNCPVFHLYKPAFCERRQWFLENALLDCCYCYFHETYLSFSSKYIRPPAISSNPPCHRTSLSPHRSAKRLPLYGFLKNFSFHPADNEILLFERNSEKPFASVHPRNPALKLHIFFCIL